MFLKFPSTVQNVQFSNDGKSLDGDSLKTRTRDGLEITLEISFQYQLRSNKLFDLYNKYGLRDNYHNIFVKNAVDVLTAVATEHPAKHFFAKRTEVLIF